jgi:hypothetical protein
MTPGSALTPLARWDGIHLVLDLPAVEAWLRRLLEGSESLSDLRLGGAGDTLTVRGTVRVKGVTSRVETDLREVRIRARRLGFRIGRMRVMAGLRVPRSLVEAALERVAPGMMTVVRGSGIVVLDLRRWIPPELDLRVVALQVLGDRVHLWFGPGSLTDWPQGERPALGAGDPGGEIAAERA